MSQEPTLIPTAVPTISQNPSLRPTSSPSVSQTPTIKSSIPSVSQEPTTIPTALPTMSKTPSIRPTSSPSVSQKPTIKTASPTISDIPTSVPTISISDVPSIMPTISNLPIALPSLGICNVTAQQRCDAIQQRIINANITSETDLQNAPQSTALDWICNVDELSVCPDDTFCSLEQRYVMAVLYYSSNGGTWDNCAEASSGSDCEPINVGEPGYNPGPDGARRWLDPVDECEWYGLRCLPDDKCIRVIQLGKFYI
uniref:Uncharacterized protein n=1 Tax=Proboscia inermis TaxID=420281 RepID=A0A7S0BVT8_9STRA